jgi:hypothetical protein
MGQEVAGGMASARENGGKLMNTELVTRATVPTSLTIMTHIVAVLMKKAVY